jgi:adenylate cyclase
MAADEGERKLTAILAADVAGYSRLMADDDRSTIRTLTDYREVFSEHVAAHKGNIVDTAGDSVLATFDSVVEAVEAAVEIQVALSERNEALPDHRRMQFRIGINLGDIIIRDDGTAYGDGVNIAARLEGLAEPGGVMVSESVHMHVEDRLGIGLEFVGEHEVKNIAKPVRAYRVLRDGQVPVAPRTRRRTPFLVTIAAGIAAIAIVAGVVWWQVQESEPPQMVDAAGVITDDPTLAIPTGPSIAVLPFDNMSGDPSQDYFADGISEQIIAALARFQDLFVIARNTTFQFKGSAGDVRDIAEELGVRFVLEGSVHKSDTFVRVTAQLIDGASGSHVWAESYDRELTAATVFAIQDEITEQVVATLAGGSGILVRHIGQETKSAEPGSWDAFECVMLVSEFFNVTYTPENHLVVTECLENAMESTPNYVDGWANLALLHLFAGYAAELNPGEDYLERGVAAAHRAVELDPTSQMARRALAVANFFSGNVEKFKIEAEAAIAINPNDADALAELGQLLAFTGEWDRGYAITQKAIKLNPYFPDWVIFTLAKYYLVKGDMDAAVEAAKRINLPDYWVASLTQAYVYASAGRQAEAEAAVATLLDLRPDMTIALARQFYELWQFEPSYINAFVERGLRRAGLPEDVQGPSRPVIAVLPFTNMSGDPEQEYFADGITEDIITALNRFEDVSVIGRTRMFQYKGRTFDISNVHEETGAVYIVEGSVRRDQNAVRITAQVTDVKSGTLLWSNNYQKDLGTNGIFQVQDDITQHVVGSIAGQYGAVSLALARGSGAVPVQSLSAQDCVYRAHQYFRELRWEDHAVTRDCLEQATKSDPTYGDAWALLAGIYAEEYSFELNTRPNSLDRALRAAQQAVALDNSNALFQQSLAEAHFYRHEKDQLIVATEAAIALNPNDSGVLMTLGVFLAWAGEWEQGAKLIHDGVVLNAHLPTWYHFPLFYNEIRKRDYEDALAEAQQFNAPDAFWTHAAFAIAYAQLGRIGDARTSVERLLELYPNFGEQAYDEYRKWIYDEALVEHSIEGLRKAGLDVPYSVQ